jgi:transposase-like protein
MNQVPFSTNTGARAAQEIQGPPADANRAGANALEGFDPRALDSPGPMSGRRRRFTNEEKRRFLDEAAASGESMSSVGRRYGLSVSLLFRWRRQLDGSQRPNPRTTEEGARAEHGAEGLGLLQAIKNALDPRSILNPGKLIPRTE